MNTAILTRRPDEPAPDLLDYTVVHRAMTTDMRRLADLAEAVADGGEALDARRAGALRTYLANIGAEIRSHHRVEDDHVWPFLVAVTATTTGLVELTTDHDRLDPLLDTADELAAGLVARPRDREVGRRLADTLRELERLLADHVADEERLVFPLIRRYVRVEDYRRLQRRFRGNLSLRALAFAAPWVASHATPQELPALLADAGVTLRALLRLVGGRFADLQRRVFG